MMFKSVFLTIYLYSISCICVEDKTYLDPRTKR